MLVCLAVHCRTQVLEERATLAGDIKPEIARLSHGSRNRKRLAGGKIENELSAGATTHRTKCFQLFDKAGVQRGHYLLSTQQQPMDMAALRNRLMKCWPVFNAVSFEDGDSVKMIGENPRGHQTSQATADNDSMLAEVISHAFLCFHSVGSPDNQREETRSSYSFFFHS